MRSCMIFWGSRLDFTVKMGLWRNGHHCHDKMERCFIDDGCKVIDSPPASGRRMRLVRMKPARTKFHSGCWRLREATSGALIGLREFRAVVGAEQARL